MPLKPTLEVLMTRPWSRLSREQRALVQGEHRRRREERESADLKVYRQKHAALEKQYGCKIRFTANEHSAGNVGSMFFYPAIRGKYVLYAPGGNRVYPNRDKMLKAACKIQKRKRRR